MLATRRVLRGALAIGCIASAACAAELPRTRTEDDARRAAPIPACVLHLPASKAATPAGRALREPEYWKLVFPGFDGQKLPDDPIDCTGHRLRDDKAVGAATPRGRVEEGDMVLGAGADRLKAVWLRSHKTDDGRAFGALALVRGLETQGEAYGVGTLHALETKTALRIERLGPDVAVLAIEDTCAGRAPAAPCETTIHVFLAWRGRLLKVADVVSERVAYGMNTEPGFPGKIEYHLSASVEFSPQGVRVLEQIRARTLDGKELRKAELDRALLLDGGKPLRATAEPLWPRVVPVAKP